MSHYKPNLRDIEFNLFEVLGRDQVLGQGPYEEIDADVAHEMLAEVARLAVEDLAPSLVDSDRNPPVFDPATHAVTTPESFRRSYQAYVDAECWRADVPAELGGTAVPPSLRWAIAELVLGANPAVHMYCCGFAFAKVLHVLGNDDQKVMAQHMVDHHWGGTMVLTEPDAGSDVGAGRPRPCSSPTARGTSAASSGSSPRPTRTSTTTSCTSCSPRPEGAGPGTKGLSLFVVPKFHVDLETGELGERNGVFVTNVEHKMGLKVSTTCELRFGEVDGIPAVGTLLGDVHDGIAQMFKIIEYARMMVGTKAIATLSTGYLNALDYAKERVQGADLTQMTDKAAPRVTITHHPDVRRSLMPQKAYAEGLRALVLYTAAQQDTVAVADAAGGARGDGRAGQRPAAADRQGRSAPSARGCCSAPSRCRRSAAPASCRTTRSSSTSATPRSTPSTRARRRSRAWTSSSARSCGTRARRSSTSPPRSPSSSRPAARTTPSPPSASCSARRSTTSRASSAPWSARS